MKWIGRTILDKDTGDVGIVLKESPTLKDFYKVRFWREERQAYVTKTMSSKWFTYILPSRTADSLESINVTDPGYCEAAAEAARDLALLTRDRKWFDSVKGDLQKQK